MTIETAIQQHFVTSSPYILPSVQNRVYRLKAPQTAVSPYVVIFRVGVSPRNTHGGPVNVQERLVQLSAFADALNPIDIGEITDQIRRNINGFRGMMGDLKIAGVFWENERYVYEEGAKFHHIAADYTFQYYDS